MSLKILTHSIAGIDDFMLDPCGVLKEVESGTIAVFANNAPAFYAITAERLEQLLKLEAQMVSLRKDVMFNRQFFSKTLNTTIVPMEKFMMYKGWQPDADFQQQAALWGISLRQAVTPEELTAFIVWWQAEGKMFTHIQWEQKLARSLQIGRSLQETAGTIKGRNLKRNINTFSQPDTHIPHGFRGAK